MTVGTRAFWRIGTDAADYESTDLSGEGARRGGGRWNRPGQAVIYSASTISLACLETLVHLPGTALPLNRYLVKLDVPESLLKGAIELTFTSAPVGWDATPPGKTSLDFGDSWLTEGRSALLIVPSAIVQEEQNLLINPAHPEAQAVIATKVRRWTYDPRVIKAAHLP